MNTLALPMRWSDLDPLRHVNNVVVVSYATEAWPQLRLDGVIGDREPSRLSVEYHLPILKSEQPVRIDSVVDGTTLTQRLAPGDADRTAATVVTDFSAPISSTAVQGRAAARPLALRFSDIEAGGVVGAAGTFELFQEVRVPYFRALSSGPVRMATFVLAQQEAEFFAPIRWQDEPLDGRAWVSRVGGASFGVTVQLCRGEDVLAQSRAVMVAFDAATQRSATFTDEQRELLRAAIIE